MTKARVVAVVPAAGRGERLGLAVPKLLVPVEGDRTVWDVLESALRPSVEHVQLVLSPAGQTRFLERYGENIPADLSIVVQPAPTGMGDAVFRGADGWRAFSAILVVWGDQVLLSRNTVERIVSTLRTAGARSICLPLCRAESPYVEYVFEGTRLARIRQSREGDACEPGGWADVGAFGLSTDGLVDAWRRYREIAERGETTGELNFLPFLAYLAGDLGWNVHRTEVVDANESLGINTPEDLERVRSILRTRGGGTKP